jgi:hypothetical protein
VSELADLRIGYFTSLLAEKSIYDNYNEVVCPLASNFFPLANLSLLERVVEDTTLLDVGLLDLASWARGVFPYPTNGSDVSQIAGWSVNSTANDSLALHSDHRGRLRVELLPVAVCICRQSRHSRNRGELLILF